MSGDVETEAPRPRPLSGGLWTLFSWLRRDEQGSSSESLSSAGSDRTVASFAFLSPAHYRVPTPLVLPPPGPPTDSYRKRVRDRNLRRQHDRDLTLHRKYGLYRDLTVGYDVTSLPSARRSAHGIIDKQERERRAASESLQRRTPYVPGKRRAPPPPARASSAATSVSLPHRHLRKRRAPQPPIKFKEKEKEKEKENIGVETDNADMNSRPAVDKNIANIDLGCRSQKYVKKEQRVNTYTETKLKQERNFLKQIFDNKKRKSAIETSSIKILPSISELDKQAAEIIEIYRSKEREQNNNALKMDQKDDSQNSDVSKRARWICITCLRRFDMSVNRCSFCLSSQRHANRTVKETNRNESIYTQTEQNSSNVTTSKHIKEDERQHLKKMLKEMKDSLPKKHKPPEKNIAINDEKRTLGIFTNKKDVVPVTETPTLRIGSKQKEQNADIGESLTSSSIKTQELSNHTPKHDDTNEIVRKILLQDNVNLEEKHQKTKIIVKNLPDPLPATSSQSDRNATFTSHDIQRTKLNINTTNGTESVDISEKGKLHTPLKISSLLNPIYIPKESAETAKFPANTPKEEDKNIIEDEVKIITDVKTDKINLLKMTPTVANSSSKNQKVISKDENINKIEALQRKTSPPNNVKEPSKLVKKISTESQTCSVNQKAFTSKVNEINQHSRRRELINQLENSIAKGDERAAAEAAAKLAQLRLSCSVLSFTSHILGQQSAKDIASVKSETQTNISEPQTVVEKNIIKNKAVPNFLKDSRIIAGGQQEIKQQIAEVRSEKSEPGCSKLLHPPFQKVDQANTSTSQRETYVEDSELISISVWIEDKEAARGPIKLEVGRGARLGALRRQAEAALGIAARLQRWIVGRALCTDDATPLRDVAGPDLTAPFYLCLVEFDTRQKSASPNKDTNTTKQSTDNSDNRILRSTKDKNDVYTELMQLERQAFVPNAEAFECQVCMEECPPGNGVVLRDCVHSFCRDCLAHMIRHCEEPAVSCPAMGCPGTLHEREIRALVSPEEYEKWLARGLAAAESGTRNAFHCRTRDCRGWALCEAGVRKFPCPVCKRNNCVPCQAIHEGETCEQYRANMQQAANKVPNQTDEGTKALLESLISRGEALKCPECSAIITKKWGCDWVKCSACKTEICWVTRGRRWGPAGRGDTSAGCRCGVDGKRCHPSCGYCH